MCHLAGTALIHIWGYLLWPGQERYAQTVSGLLTHCQGNMILSCMYPGILWFSSHLFWFVSFSLNQYSILWLVFFLLNLMLINYLNCMCNFVSSIIKSCIFRCHLVYPHKIFCRIQVSMEEMEGNTTSSIFHML